MKNHSDEIMLKMANLLKMDVKEVCKLAFEEDQMDFLKKSQELQDIIKEFQSFDDSLFKVKDEKLNSLCNSVRHALYQLYFFLNPKDVSEFKKPTYVDPHVYELVDRKTTGEDSLSPENYKEIDEIFSQKK